MPRGTLFRDDLEERLKDPKAAAHFIQAALEENDPEFFTEALSIVVKAWGVTDIAEQTGIARQAIYQMVSANGNPTIKNIMKILDQLGLALTVKQKRASGE